MKKLSNNELSELCSLMSEIERRCKDYCHIGHIEAVKRIAQIAESTYQQADNILNERSDECGKDLHYSANRKAYNRP